jgi:hypothetical protein
MARTARQGGLWCRLNLEGHGSGEVRGSASMMTWRGGFMR